MHFLLCHQRLGLSGKKSIESYRFQSTTRFFQKDGENHDSSSYPSASSNGYDEFRKLFAHRSCLIYAYIICLCKILNFLFAKRIFLFISEDKIEIQLRGHPYNNLATHHYTKSMFNHFQNNSENAEVAFLAFTILRSLSMIAPFIEDFMKKQIGVITGELSWE